MISYKFDLNSSGSIKKESYRTTYFFYTVISKSIEYRVEYNRSHGKQLADREDDQKLVLVKRGRGLHKIKINDDFNTMVFYLHKKVENIKMNI